MGSLNDDGNLHGKAFGDGISLAFAQWRSRFVFVVAGYLLWDFGISNRFL